MFLHLDQALFLISTSLLVPVLLALTLLLIWTLLLFGGFAGEYLSRRNFHHLLRPAFKGLLQSPQASDHHDGLKTLSRNLPLTGFLSAYLQTCWAGQPTDLIADKSIDDIEIEMSRRLAALSTFGRLGPMLGLAGTLIPLGPALVELSRGNVAALAGQLVVAFSATIIGLLVGMISIACAQIRRSWYAKDLSDILFLEELRTTPATESK